MGSHFQYMQGTLYISHKKNIKNTVALSDTVIRPNMQALYEDTKTYTTQLFRKKIGDYEMFLKRVFFFQKK